MLPYVNPVVPGCHPDPSACRVGDEYFLVTSSFTYFPGLPIHRSVNLTDWELIGHVLADPAQLDLDGLDVSDGVWAPTIRHSAGMFYVVFSIAHNRRGAGTYLTTASAATGPWSPLQRLDAEGIDPSLFFDDDGRCWFTACRDARDPERTGPGEIWMRELDLKTLTLVGAEHVLWHGAMRGQWVEGPRIVKRGGRYHLIAAEGGTERHHAVTAASADTPTGPYTTDPRSPLLTHRHLGKDWPVQNVGHADLVDTPDGSTWAIVLGVRLIDGVHTLGREVFLVPVAWDQEGPVFAPGTGVVAAAGAFDAPPPAPRHSEWVTLRGPVEYWQEGSNLNVAPRPAALTSRGRPALVGRRQERHCFRFEATVDCATAPHNEAGLVAFHDDHTFASIAVTQHEGTTVLEAAHQSRDGRVVLARRQVAGAVRLALWSTGRSYHLGHLEREVFVPLASVSHRTLSTEVAGGFVGVLLGVFNRADPGATAVTFALVDYRSLTSELVDTASMEGPAEIAV